MKKILITIIAVLIGFASFAQTSYCNNAIVRSYEHDMLTGEKVIAVSVQLNKTNDTITWYTSENLQHGVFPVTKVEVHGNQTIYRCNPNKVKEYAQFTTIKEADNIYCILLLRKKYGYIKCIFKDNYGWEG